jgi:hypothetical protein
MTSRSNPSTLAVAVTPSDTVGFIQGPCRALYVGVAGNVSVLSGGADVVFVGVQAGSILPVETARVNSTATTATNIVALF